MKPFSVLDACNWSGGSLLQGSGERFVNRVSTDTRTLQPGDLFVALRGEHFNGHDYAAAAAQKGAIAMLCDEKFDAAQAPAGLSLICVNDTLTGLQQLASAYRQSLDVRVVGITGSNGKTSTKEMVAAALEVQFDVQKTQGNLNNHIGVPLTLLSLEESTEIAVVEMGMNHPGEIQPLAEMAAPDIGIVTGIGWVHVEAFDSRDGIAEEKGALIRALSDSGTAIVNGDDSLLDRTEAWTKARIIRAGFGESNTIRISEVSATEAGTLFKVAHDGESVEVSIPLFGAHMAANAALALAAAQVCGVSLEAAASGLSQLELPGGRLKLHRHLRGWILDDTYNASPDSIVAGMDSLRLIPGEGRRVALLGAMAELGNHSEQLHRWVGEQAAQKQIDLLGVMGPDANFYLEGAKSEGMDASRMQLGESHQKMARAYLDQSEPSDVILVKGSRSMSMEQVVSLIQEE
ncbi:MAG: UDP-N-acetylmuramoyl-tripeptide--D-alanyl-D-alanine ligase, partial [Verrucomicrobiota bacterium]